MFAVKKIIIAVLCISFLIISPSATFAGATWNKIKNHFKKYEIKIQGCTTEQWSEIVSPKTNAFYANSGTKSSKLTTKKKVLYAVGAAVVAGGIIYVIAENNDSNDDPVVHPAGTGK